MREYEYVVGALEGYLCEQLASVICMENYENDSHPHGFRHIFDEFIQLREEYETNKIKQNDEWREQAASILDSFVEDIGRTVPKDKINASKDHYLAKLDEEEYKTLGKRIAIYPYLISEARKIL